MLCKCEWTVISSFSGGYTNGGICMLGVFQSLENALEYAAFVVEYDEEHYTHWLTYVIEGDFIHVKPDQK